MTHYGLRISEYRACRACTLCLGTEAAGDDDRPFIVLTETKFSLRCIPVWIGTLLTGLGSKQTHVIMFSP